MNKLMIESVPNLYKSRTTTNAPSLSIQVVPCKERPNYFQVNILNPNRKGEIGKQPLNVIESKQFRSQYANQSDEGVREAFNYGKGLREKMSKKPEGKVYFEEHNYVSRPGKGKVNLKEAPKKK